MLEVTRYRVVMVFAAEICLLDAASYRDRFMPSDSEHPRGISIDVARTPSPPQIRRREVRKPRGDDEMPRTHEARGNATGADERSRDMAAGGEAGGGRGHEGGREGGRGREGERERASADERSREIAARDSQTPLLQLTEQDIGFAREGRLGGGRLGGGMWPVRRQTLEQRVHSVLVTLLYSFRCIPPTCNTPLLLSMYPSNL